MRLTGSRGTKVDAYPILRCERCGRDTRHSTNGRCLELHRGKPLARGKRLRSERDPEERERWALTKAAVFERDNWQCQRCGSRGWIAAGDLDCHHRALKGHGGTSNEECEYGMAGLITLCRHCHDFVHTHRVDAERLGFIIPRFPGDDPESVPCLTVHGWAFLLAGGSRVAVAAEPGGAQ